MARQRFDNIFGTATGNPITVPSGAGTATLASTPGPGVLPAVTGSDFFVLIIEPGTVNEDIRYAQYSGSGTSITVGTAQEGTTGISHTGVAWAHGPTAADFASSGSFPTYSGAGSPQGVQASVAASDSYLDTTNGGVYFANNPSRSSPNAWQAGIASTPTIGTNPVPGLLLDQSDDFLWILSQGGTFVASGIGLSDTAAAVGTFNGFFTGTSGVDGDQFMQVRLGSSGQFTWTFDTNGTLSIPGPLGPNYIIQSGTTYAMNGTEGIVQMTSNSSPAVTLPDPSAFGFLLYTIKNAGTGALALHAHGTEHIDGVAGPKSLASEAFVTVISDFTNWWSVA